ncbi:MAG: CoA transferase [Chloroflexota bacterium]|nr:CoA transferase [Chloroflexota bacterium]
MVDQVLSDVVVLDFTQDLAGSFCTKMLADYGAEVIKVERPGTGDRTRRYGPFPNDDPDPEKSGLFLFLNTNKKSITLDLKTDIGSRIAKDLAKDAQIVVESFRPGVMERFGLGHAELEKINPNLVMTSISTFGQTGPYRDFKATDIVLFALGGPMYVAGEPDGGPVKYAFGVVPIHLGYVAAGATLAGLWTAEEQGVGQQIDFSLMEALQSDANFQLAHHTIYQYVHEIPPREITGFGMIPFGNYPCKDGWVFALILQADFPILVERLMGMPELMERFPNVYDSSRKDEFDSVFINWLIEHTKDELIEMAGPMGLNIAPLNNMEDVYSNKHFNERGVFTEIDSPLAGKFKYPGRPFLNDDMPWSVERPAPRLGEHNVEILCDRLGYSKQELVRMRQMGVV